MKRKYIYLFVLQLNYGQGWEDATAEETRKEIRDRCKEYAANSPEYPRRIIKRRELNTN